MTLSIELVAEIRRLHYVEHWKRGTIAEQLGHHPDAIERALTRHGPQPKQPPAQTLLAPYLGFIDETLQRYPRLVGTRLDEMIRERGYAGSLRTLRRHLQTARPEPKHEPFLRIETLPGEQAQVDWAHVGSMPVPGGVRRLWMFVITLAFSRAFWAELVLDLDIYSLLRSLVRAAEFFGGNPRQWLFDNAKTVVVERHGDHARFHRLLLDLACELHVQPRLCTVRKPQEKGKVERLIRWLKERFFAARSFHSIEHGNVQLLKFINETGNQRPHPIHPDQTVFQKFEEERPRLLLLPTPMPNVDLVTPASVDKTAFIRFDTNRYSVPAQFVRRTISMAANDQLIRLFDGTDLIAEHKRNQGRHQVIELQEHRKSIVEAKRGAEVPKGQDRLRIEVPNIEPLFDRWFESGHNIGSMTVKTLHLLNLYGSAILVDAVGEMIQRGTFDPGALAILCDQHRQRRKISPPPIDLNLGQHVVDHDVLQHDLGGYDV
jgi:transposase